MVERVEGSISNSPSFHEREEGGRVLQRCLLKRYMEKGL
jgi:hypothetical protein